MSSEFCSNLLLFETQEHLSDLTTCFVTMEDEVSILSYDDKLKELSVFQLIKISLEQTIDHFLDQNNQMMALKLIQQNGLKQTKIWEWQLKKSNYVNSVLLKNMIAESLNEANN